MKTRPSRHPLRPSLSSPAEPPLSPARAFVVHFRDETDAGHFTGRAEHVSTGHAARFESPEELLAFFAAALRATPSHLSKE
jgi:hypothetical protein